ncbi:MAG: hypothetical protein H6622_00720 [Halobacteriovoraceae bacterium]|nr:hypothetical protein [Halobacteriovoraceae bacterium]
MLKHLLLFLIAINAFASEIQSKHVLGEVDSKVLFSELNEYAKQYGAQYQHVSLVDSKENVEELTSELLFNFNKVVTYLNFYSNLSHEEIFEFDKILGPIDYVFGQKEEAIDTINYIAGNVSSNKDFKKYARSLINKISQMYNAFVTDEKIYQIIKKVDLNKLSEEQTEVARKVFMEFEKNGIGLPADEKEHAQELFDELKRLESSYEENVTENLNEIVSFSKSELKGVPKNIIERLKFFDKKYMATNSQRMLLKDISMYAIKEETRKKAWYSAESGPRANIEVAYNILKLRKEIANLFGFKNWSEYQAIKTTTGSGKENLKFANGLYNDLKKAIDKDLVELSQIKKEVNGNTNLMAWDLGFVLREYKQKVTGLTPKKLNERTEKEKKHFPFKETLAKLFEMYEDLFDIKLEQLTPPYQWDKDVLLYQVKNLDASPLGLIFIDVAERPGDGKSPGAAMYPFVMGNKFPYEKMRTLPIGGIAANFPRDKFGNIYLDLRTRETLTHEFGHALHLLKSKNSYKLSNSLNINWDTVELPSMFMENWGRHKSVINKIAGPVGDVEFNYSDYSFTDEQEEKLELLERFVISKNNSLAKLDLKIHSMELPETVDEFRIVANKILSESGFEYPADSSFFAKFSHIFTGPYSALYFSYDWSEALVKMADERFRNERGDLDFTNKEQIKEYIQKVLEVGGTVSTKKMCETYFGGPMSTKPLLKKIKAL